MTSIKSIKTVFGISQNDRNHRNQNHHLHFQDDGTSQLEKILYSSRLNFGNGVTPINDFQLMVHPDSLDVKVIDFGEAKKISNTADIQKIQDDLFIKQCAYFAEWCRRLLNNEKFHTSPRENISRDTFELFFKKCLRQ